MSEMSVINTFEMSVIHCPVFTVFLVVITSSKNIFITLLLISLKLPKIEAAAVGGKSSR